MSVATTYSHMESHMNVSCFRSSAIIALLYLYGWSMLFLRVVNLGEHLVTDVFCTSSKVDPLFLFFPFWPLCMPLQAAGDILGPSHSYENIIQGTFFTGSVYFDTHIIWNLKMNWYLAGLHTIFLVIFMCMCVRVRVVASECIFFAITSVSMQ